MIVFSLVAHKLAQCIISKRRIKSEADMLKKPAKAIKFYSDTHDTPL